MARQLIHLGDLYWIHISKTDEASIAVAHPYVVVQQDAFNHSRIESVVVCALTTNLNKSREPGNRLLDPGEGNLPKPSAVVVSQISAVSKAALGERIGALSQRRVAQILSGLRFQQRAFFR